MPEEMYSKENQSILLKTLGESPKLRIIDFFMDNPIMDFTKKDVIDALGMSKQTFYKYFDDLLEFDMIKITRRIAKSKLYSINLSNPIIQSMKTNVDYISETIADKELKREQIPNAVV